MRLISIALVTTESQESQLVGFGGPYGDIRQQIAAGETHQVEFACGEIEIHSAIIAGAQTKRYRHVAIFFVLNADCNLRHPVILVGDQITRKFQLDPDLILANRLTTHRRAKTKHLSGQR